MDLVTQILLFLTGVKTCPAQDLWSFNVRKAVISLQRPVSLYQRIERETLWSVVWHSNRLFWCNTART